MSIMKYHYVLSTRKQKQLINLLDHINELRSIFEEFFQENLIEAIIEKDGYILKLNTEFDNNSKRLLGKRIASQTALGAYVKKFIYNDGRDISRQLFRAKK